VARYRNNFLKQVIMQVQFDPVLAFQNEAVATFREQIKDPLPRTQRIDEMAVHVGIQPGAPSTAETHPIHTKYLFSTPDGSKRVSISPVTFALEYQRYENIDRARDDFTFTWSAFQDLFDIKLLTRVGLRYINGIILTEGNPLDWSGYIDNKLISATLEIPEPPGPRLARSMHAVHWTQEDRRVVFNFGIHNRDFPNAVTRREFILDYDCFSVGTIEATELVTLFRRYNDTLSSLFEESIGERLRDRMGRED